MFYVHLSLMKVILDLVVVYLSFPCIVTCVMFSESRANVLRLFCTYQCCALINVLHWPSLLLCFYLLLYECLRVRALASLRTTMYHRNGCIVLVPSCEQTPSVLEPFLDVCNIWVFKRLFLDLAPLYHVYMRYCSL